MSKDSGSNSSDKSLSGSAAVQSSVVDLGAFRQKKILADELGQGRKPLYVSHLKGKISSANQGATNTQDFGDRLQRIRTSLDKINRLMAELKKMSASPENETSTKTSNKT